MMLVSLSVVVFIGGIISYLNIFRDNSVNGGDNGALLPTVKYDDTWFELAFQEESLVALPEDYVFVSEIDYLYSLNRPGTKNNTGYDGFNDLGDKIYSNTDSMSHIYVSRHEIDGTVSYHRFIRSGTPSE